MKEPHCEVGDCSNKAVVTILVPRVEVLSEKDSGEKDPVRMCREHLSRAVNDDPRPRQTSSFNKVLFSDSVVRKIEEYMEPYFEHCDINKEEYREEVTALLTVIEQSILREISRDEEE